MQVNDRKHDNASRQSYGLIPPMLDKDISVDGHNNSSYPNIQIWFDRKERRKFTSKEWFKPYRLYAHVDIRHIIREECNPDYLRDFAIAVNHASNIADEINRDTTEWLRHLHCWRATDESTVNVTKWDAGQEELFAEWGHDDYLEPDAFRGKDHWQMVPRCYNCYRSRKRILGLGFHLAKIDKTTIEVKIKEHVFRRLLQNSNDVSIKEIIETPEDGIKMKAIGRIKESKDASGTSHFAIRPKDQNKPRGRYLDQEWKSFSSALEVLFVDAGIPEFSTGQYLNSVQLDSFPEYSRGNDLNIYWVLPTSTSSQQLASTSIGEVQGLVKQVPYEVYKLYREESQ